MLIKCFVAHLLAAVVCFSDIQAEITEIHQIEEIEPFIHCNSFVLFNIAEVLTDSELSLGSSPWRTYVKKQAMKIDSLTYDLHDALTWLVFNQIPHKAVEHKITKLIRSLQNSGIVTAALTSRGRSIWYSTKQAGVDEMTEKVLEGIGIDFKLSRLPFYFIQQEDSYYLSHYRNGIFYSEHMEKGDFLKELLLDSGYTPGSVILVDDKLDSLISVEMALNEINIPFYGFWYTKTKKERQNFSPMIANVQLQALLKDNIILSDEIAQVIIDLLYTR
jgi:hypothetical protein